MRISHARFVLMVAAVLVVHAPADAAVQEAYFNVTSPAIEGPPYPTPAAIVTQMLEDDGMGSLEHTATFSVTLMASGSIANPPMELVAVGQGMPPAPAHNSVQYDLYYRGPASDLTPGSFFDIFYHIDIEGQPGTTPEVDVDAGFEPDGSFSTSFNMGGHKAGGGGTGVGRVGGKMRLEDSALTFGESAYYSPPDSFFDIGYRIEIYSPDPIDVSQPLTRLTLTAQTLVPEPAGFVLAVIGIAALAFRRRAS
jgi:hypothetical protein